VSSETGQPAGYSGTPLARKLGVKHDSRVLLVAAPPGFELPDVPGGVVLHRRAGSASYDVILAFCPDAERLRSRLSAQLPKLTTAGALWLAWPKRASGVSTDLDENVVRDAGLQAGLVDVKVAAIDPTWAALKFVRRLRDR
jgi:hypothetical protein